MAVPAHANQQMSKNSQLSLENVKAEKEIKTKVRVEEVQRSNEGGRGGGVVERADGASFVSSPESQRSLASVRRGAFAQIDRPCSGLAEVVSREHVAGGRNNGTEWERVDGVGARRRPLVAFPGGVCSLRRGSEPTPSTR